MSAGCAGAASKTCFKCLICKPLSDFYKHKAMADGHLNKCKECTKSDVGKHRNEHIARIREYDRARSKTPKRLEQNRRVSSQWRKNNPIRRAAQVAVGNAVRDGRLVPTPCVECGAKAEAHHPDYSRPLDVVWLCPPHHKQTHALFTRLTKAQH